MLKVEIKNKQSQIVTNIAQFATQQEVNAWVAKCEADKAFGPEGSYDIEVLDISLELQAEQEKQAKILAGQQAREVCQKVLDYVAGANLDKALSIEQITQMQQTYANAEAALRAARPTLAKQLIQAISVDGVLVTSVEKQACLDFLAQY